MIRKVDRQLDVIQHHEVPPGQIESHSRLSPSEQVTRVCVAKARSPESPIGKMISKTAHTVNPQCALGDCCFAELLTELDSPRIEAACKHMDYRGQKTEKEEGRGRKGFTS